jgi:hypothetical protein
MKPFPSRLFSKFSQLFSENSLILRGLSACEDSQVPERTLRNEPQGHLKRTSRTPQPERILREGEGRDGTI